MKTKKRFHILSLLLVFVCFCLWAGKKNPAIKIDEKDKLRIEHVGTYSHKVKINGIDLKKGDIFMAKDKIKLNDNEYIKVTHKKKGFRIIICGYGLKQLNVSSVKEFIDQLYIHGKGLSDFSKTLESWTWQMISDTVLITSPVKLDKKKNGFFLTTIPGNRRLSPIPFYSKTNELVLSKEFFDENQIRIDDGQTYRFLVEYYEITGRHDTITDDFKIEYIPEIK